ncbi:MAG: FAD-binding oxidoreductase [Deltaproteobacteria bacterium]|nr:FAD-binding oxidoreductase [Deltaproteobacteria bacterium]
MSGETVVVVGGGIAGLATAWQLARLGARVCLVEMEPAAATHASGRNAAIFRSVDMHPDTAGLATRSRALLNDLGVPGALRARGVLLLGPEDRVDALATRAREHTVRHERLDPNGCARRAPLVAGGGGTGGLWVPGDGVLDVHAVVQALLGRLRAAGAEVLLGCPVALSVTPGGAQVRLADGTVRQGGAVVLAAGAWSSALAGRAGLGLPLRAMRRHLAHLGGVENVDAEHPVVWGTGPDEVYFRPESGGLLASPCDEAEGPPGEPPIDETVAALLAERLGRLAPAVAGAQLRRLWTCQRTFAPDREFVLGPDPRAPSVVWATGLGGRGMTCGLALGELAARAALGLAPAPAAMLPGRLLPPAPGADGVAAGG